MKIGSYLGQCITYYEPHPGLHAISEGIMFDNSAFYGLLASINQSQRDSPSSILELK